MDAKTMVEILKLCIESMDTLIDAISLALMQYQTEIEEARLLQTEGSVENE